jgi:hypothetical protein
MWLKTDHTAIHLFRICILVSVDNAQLLFLTFFKNMPSSEDTNKLLNVNQPFQLQICHAALLPPSLIQ